MADEVSINFFIIHGSMLFLAWGLFSIVQIASNRYMKAHWQTNLWIHRLAGASMLIITLFFALYAWGFVGWKVIVNWHAYFVFPILFTVFFIALGGVITRSCLRRSRWNTSRALKVKTVHRTFAYLVILGGIGAIASGIYYYRVNPAHPFDFPLEWVAVIFTVSIMLTLEVVHQFSLRSEDAFRNDTEPISLHEFHARINKGE